jgi:hypothetical protein
VTAHLRLDIRTNPSQIGVNTMAAIQTFPDVRATHSSSADSPARLRLALHDGAGDPGAPAGMTGELAGRPGCPVEFEHYIVPGTGGHGRARADGLLAVTRAFGCRTAVYGYDATRNDKFLIMTGIRPALDALDLVVPAIAAQMEQAAWAAVKGYASLVGSALPQVSGKAQRRILVAPYFRAFLRGYGVAVAETIRALRAKAIKAEGPELGRILAADQARVDEAFRRDFPDRQQLRAERTSHRAGLLAGTRAGRQVDLGDGYLITHDLVFAML